MSDGFVTKISTFSVKNFRFTFLWVLLILIFGFISYTTLLPRDGFPALEFPTAFVQTIYPVNDKNLVEEDVTSKIVESINTLDTVESVDSTSSDNFSFIVISFKNETDTEEEVKKLVEEIERSDLAPEIKPEVINLNAATVDGENNIILGVVRERLISDDAHFYLSEEIAAEIQNLENVSSAEVIPHSDQIFNPITSELTLVETSFNKYGEKVDDSLFMKDTYLIGVKNEEGKTANEVSKEIVEKIESINENEDFEAVRVVSVYDQAIGLNEQISSLESNALGTLLIVAITLFFFVSFRASIIAVIFIPVVMAATFLTLLFIGVSLNVISLFALILTLGLLVDDAIVIIESIDYYKRNGVNGIDAVRRSINDVGKADVVGTITTMMAFFPMLFIIGFLGDIIRDVPITVIVTLFWSLVVALTLIPLLSNIIIPTRTNDDKNFLYWLFNYSSELVMFYGRVFGKFVGIYTNRWYLNIIVIVLSIMLIGLSGLFAKSLKFVDFPDQKDSNKISVEYTFIEGLSVERKKEITKDVQDIFINDYLEEIVKISYPQVGRNYRGVDSAEMTVDLESLLNRRKTSVEIAEEVTEKIEESDDVTITVNSAGVGGPPSSEYQSTIQLYGSDLESLDNTAELIKEFIEEEVVFTKEVKVSDVVIKNTDSIVKKDGRQYLSINTKLEGEVDDAMTRAVSDQVKEEFNEDRLKDLGLETDAIGDDRGFASEIFESVISAGVALLGSFVAIYIFLVITFNSFTRAMLIMIAIPFSFTGLFAGLSLTNNSISFFVIIGMIALVGIVVNNTVMLLEFAIQGREMGDTIPDSITKAVKLRFRPLMTTSMTTILGLIPLALTEPLWESLAFSILFGLASSTALVILAFPAYYTLVEQIKAFTREKVIVRL